eukprot:CAMPEP_0172564560 /NCGR_PEP_ID=MMETSP1067-20121228/104883_1 /TAXON_ID=265564 ORGANISM="Thalassiosira punctigera, Strain Tpunct2005C2" /NCGR_SAMPLE_ID=MMETSP1067 /ASSEMBLY_ACC=CAM_ASM_000444 /LENGTH=115 /DNA_ID=CAMNT_0013355263 /DNA_START=121 /DNA_END=469 /DNA_ORIENTATION=+
MPDKSLRRLESYQSGGNVGDGEDDGASYVVGIVVGDVARASAGGRGSSSPSGNHNGAVAPPPLLAQFSLIGRGDDEGEGTAVEDSMMAHVSDDVGGGGARGRIDEDRRWQFFCHV